MANSGKAFASPLEGDLIRFIDIQGGFGLLKRSPISPVFVTCKTGSSGLYRTDLAMYKFRCTESHETFVDMPGRNFWCSGQPT